jgi:hypothetical protein
MMDFDQAITAHSAWKRKLTDYLSKRDGSLNAGELGADNKCPLGQWIYGEGSKHSRLPEYATLKDQHALFHRTAAEVVRRANSDPSASVTSILGVGTEFSRASSAVVLALAAMKHKAAK